MPKTTQFHSGFNKPVAPSKELAAIVGHHSAPRTKIVARLWSYIKQHGLQDSADKRTIVPDAKLRAVLGQDRVGMFQMNRLISAHLTTNKAAAEAQLPITA